MAELTPLREPSLNVLKIEGPNRHVFLLHGWDNDLSRMQPLGKLLCGQATVHLIDLPGFGDSADPPFDEETGDAWGTLEYARRMVGLMDELGADKVDVVGHSYGGRVAVQMAANFPERIRSITLLAAAGLPVLRSWSQQIKYRFRAILKVPSPDYKKASKALRLVFVRAVNEDLSAVARQVHCPCLLIWGDKDDQTPLDMGTRYHALIQSSELVTLPGRGHYLIDGYGAHICASHVLRFLAKVAHATPAGNK